MKSMETGRQDGGSDKNHAPFSVGKTGNISRKFLTIILKIFDKNFERLQEVFNKYNRLVRKMVISRSGNDMLAEEICQQVFLQYFEQMNNISEELIQPWLLLTTRNMVYDYLRKMQVRKDTHSINGIEDFMVIHEDNTERVITRLSHNMLTERILEELYDKKKEWYYVIMDICILQMSYEEAAKHLNIEVQVLRARLYRARRYIRKKYGEEYQEL